MLALCAAVCCLLPAVRNACVLRELPEVHAVADRAFRAVSKPLHR